MPDRLITRCGVNFSRWLSGTAAPISLFLGTGFELHADTACLDRLFVSVPGEALNPDGGDIAAHATKTIHDRNLGRGARRSQCGG